MQTIGLDFGNVNSFPCIVLNMNEETRRGGYEIPLLPTNNNWNSGIPTCYFCSPDGPARDRYGLEAKRAAPKMNQRFLLKRRLLNTERFPGAEQIGTRQVRYDEVVTKMIEYIVRKANEVLKQERGETSTDISLAYPVDFNHAEMERLIALAEQATLEDGRNVRVVGTIQEPAAAALAYLSSLPAGNKDEYNVIVYDLGGGTFDIASVTAYVNGRRRGNGVTYYDIKGMDGAQIGGNEFDDILERIAVKKLGFRPTGQAYATFRMNLEQAKIDLDQEDEVLLEVGNDEITLTKKEFEDASRPLIRQTIDMLENLLRRQSVPRPEMMLLTGGQSQMPLIREMLSERFRDFNRDQIISYSPQKAIAYGAARYGIMPEPDTTPVVQKHNQFAIGTLVSGKTLGTSNYIDILIPERSDLPTPELERDWKCYCTDSDNQTYIDCSIYEAQKPSPDKYNIYTDFTETITFIYHFSKAMPKRTRVEMCAYVDGMDVIHVLARDPNDPGHVEEVEKQLQNII